MACVRWTTLGRSPNVVLVCAKGTTGGARSLDDFGTFYVLSTGMFEPLDQPRCSWGVWQTCYRRPVRSVEKTTAAVVWPTVQATRGGCTVSTDLVASGARCPINGPQSAR